MPIVDIDKLEKAELKKKEDQTSIVSKVVGGKHYFKGRFIDAWYDSLDECQKANQDFNRKKTNEAIGLNEQGQTPEQVRRMDQKRKLDKDIADMRKKLSDMESNKRNFDAQEDPKEVKKEPAKKK